MQIFSHHNAFNMLQREKVLYSAITISNRMNHIDKCIDIKGLTSVRTKCIFVRAMATTTMTTITLGAFYADVLPQTQHCKMDF